MNWSFYMFELAIITNLSKKRSEKTAVGHFECDYNVHGKLYHVFRLIKISQLSLNILWGS